MARYRLGECAPVSAQPALALRDVTAGYGRRPAVENLSGVFAAGSLTAVTGPNGAGKTTLLKAITGEIPLLGGVIERHTAPGGIACLPQVAEIDRRFPVTVADVVLPGLWRSIGAFGGSGADHRRRLAEAIATVGLAGFETRGIGTLSSGQFQRILFARLLLQSASVILLDEPFAGVDERTTGELLALVERWREEGRTVIAVLHDLAQIRTGSRRPFCWRAKRSPGGRRARSSRLATSTVRGVSPASGTPPISSAWISGAAHDPVRRRHRAARRLRLHAACAGRIAGPESAPGRSACCSSCAA